MTADKSKRNAGSCVALNNHNLRTRVKKEQIVNLFLDPYAHVERRSSNASISTGSLEKPASGSAVTVPVGKIVKTLMDMHAPFQRAFSLALASFFDSNNCPPIII